MKITAEHLYHGAALTQIAEHPSFTAINGIRVHGTLHRSAFRINDSISVYFKYATKPAGPHQEYVFTFNSTHLDDLQELARNHGRLYIGLVCVKAEEICCIPYAKLLEMLAERRRRITGEDVSTVLVAAPKGRKLRVYMNLPGKKGLSLTQHLVARSAFPNDLFEAD